MLFVGLHRAVQVLLVGVEFSTLDAVSQISPKGYHLRSYLNGFLVNFSTTQPLGIIWESTQHFHFLSFFFDLLLCHWVG